MTSTIYTASEKEVGGARALRLYGARCSAADCAIAITDSKDIKHNTDKSDYFLGRMGFRPFMRHLDVYEFLRKTILYNYVKRKKWCVLFIEHRMCLNRDTHTNICSPAWVLNDGWSSFTLFGQNRLRQSSKMWFQKWNTSSIFSTFNHALSIKGGRGRGFWAACNRAKLHMLS